MNLWSAFFRYWKWFLQACGYVFLALFLYVTGTLAYQVVTFGPKEIRGSDPDLVTVAKLFSGEVDLLQSHTITGSWAGDSEKAFVVQASAADQRRVLETVGGVRADALPAALNSAFRFLDDTLGSRISWFPAYDQVVGSDSYYLILLRPIGPLEHLDSARLLILHPASDRVYYGQLKM